MNFRELSFLGRGNGSGYDVRDRCSRLGDRMLKEGSLGRGLDRVRDRNLAMLSRVNADVIWLRKGKLLLVTVSNCSF